MEKLSLFNSVYLVLKNCNLSFEKFCYTLYQTFNLENAEQQGNKSKMISFSGSFIITDFISVYL